MGILSYLKIIEEIDFIGSKAKLKLNSKNRNKSTFGGLLCLVIYILMFLGFLYFGQEIYLKVVPTTFSSDIINYNTSVILNSDLNSFFFIFSLKDRDGSPIGDNYFNTKVKLQTVSKVNANLNDELSSEISKNEEQTLNSTKCSLFNIGDARDYLSHLNLTNWKCLNDVASISGSYNSKFMSKVNLEISLCDNSTLPKSQGNATNSVCKSQEEILAKLNRVSVKIVRINTAFDFRNYTYPVKYFLTEDSFSLKSLLKIVYTLTSVEIHSDNGYILEGFNVGKVVKSKFLRENLDFDKNNSSVYFQLEFLPDELMTKYYRKYYKVQSLLAEMGGLGKSFVIMALILNYFNDQSNYYEKLIDELFDGDDLYKYFQYYQPNNKQIFRKYRDSIFLKNAKAIDEFKRDYEMFKNSSSSALGNGQKINNFISKRSTKKNFDNPSNLEIKGIVTNCNEKNEERYNEHPENDEKEIYNFAKIRSNSEEPKSPSVNIRAYNTSNIINNMNSIVTNKKMSSKLSKLIEIQNDNNRQDNLSNASANSIKDEKMILSENIKNNQITKDNFNKIKSKSFTLSSWEAFKFTFGLQNTTKKYVFNGGKEMIHNRTDIVYILRKNLEFDRFKSLMLQDYQILLLNSLSKFMLDPERVNLVDFNKCNYEKFVDAYCASLENKTMVDINLCNWVNSKFHLDK